MANRDFLVRQGIFDVDFVCKMLDTYMEHGDAGPATGANITSAYLKILFLATSLNDSFFPRSRYPEIIKNKGTAILHSTDNRRFWDILVFVYLLGIDAYAPISQGNGGCFPTTRWISHSQPYFQLLQRDKNLWYWYG